MLTIRNIPFVQIDGSISTQERIKTLAKFQNEQDMPLLLMTLGTGSVGQVLCLLYLYCELC